MLRSVTNRLLTATIAILGLVTSTEAHAVGSGGYHRVRTFGQGRVAQPSGLAIDRTTGRVYVADNDKCIVSVFEKSGRYRGYLGGLGGGPGKLLNPYGIACGEAGDLYAVDTGYHTHAPGEKGGDLSGPIRVARFGRDGRFRNEMKFTDGPQVRGLAGNGPDGGVTLIQTNAAGDVLVNYTRDLKKPKPLGFSFDGSEPAFIAADRRGYWVSVSWDVRSNQVATSSPSGSEVRDEIVRIDTHGKVQKHFTPNVKGSISGLAMDAVSGRLYVAEKVHETYELGPNPELRGRNQIHVYDRRLKPIAVFPTDRPDAMAIAANGDIAIVNNHGVQIYARQ